jgi:hypothetical protein
VRDAGAERDGRGLGAEERVALVDDIRPELGQRLLDGALDAFRDERERRAALLFDRLALVMRDEIHPSDASLLNLQAVVDTRGGSA